MKPASSSFCGAVCAPMDVFFTVNEGYFEPFRVALFSVLLHNASESTPVRAHVISCTPFSAGAQAAALEVADRFPGASLQFHTLSADFTKGFSFGVSYISKEGWLRLCIPDAFPEIDRALYLDADLVCTGSLRDLWNTDLQGALLAGARDVGIVECADWRLPAHGFGPDELYINSGVLLLDCRRMREECAFEKLVKTALEHSGWMQYMDQDVINWTLRGRIRELPPECNVCSVSMGDEALMARASVVHFTGPVKPWKVKYYQCGPAQRRWFAYQRLAAPDRFRNLAAGLENWITPRVFLRSLRRTVRIFLECARLRRKLPRRPAGS